MEISEKEFVKLYLNQFSSELLKQEDVVKDLVEGAKEAHRFVTTYGVLLDAEKWEEYTNRFEGLEEMVEDYREAYKELKRKYLDLQRRSGME